VSDVGCGIITVGGKKLSLGVLVPGSWQFFFLIVLGFELRTLCLLGRLCT
jgi:hypothetical protein